jgi:hypothetical protein
VEITREGTTKDLCGVKYQNLASKNKGEENELGLKWLIEEFMSNAVKNILII